MIDKMICLLAFKSQKKDNLYLDYALKLIEKIQSETNLPITIMTDSKYYFNGKLVHVIECDQPSFTKKIDVCKMAIKYGYTAVYIDVDTTLDFKLLEKTNFQDGFHYWWWWKTELKSYNQLNDKRYFKKLQDYCESNGLVIDNAPLIHEGFFVIKKSHDIENFFRIYDELTPIAIQNDLDHGNYPTGRAEGLLIGIALSNSEYRDNGCGQEMILLGHKLNQDKSADLKHLRHSIENPDILNNKTFI